MICRDDDFLILECPECGGVIHHDEYLAFRFDFGCVDCGVSFHWHNLKYFSELEEIGDGKS